MMDKLVRKRGSARAEVTKLASKVDGLLNNEDTTISDLKQHINLMKDRTNQLQHLDNKIVELIEDEDMDAEMASQQEYRDRSIVVITKMEEVIEEVNQKRLEATWGAPSNKPAAQFSPDPFFSVTEPAKKLNLKLPELKIEKF